MIPALDEVIEGWRFVARRQGLEGDARVDAVTAGLAHAQSLAGDEADEPAALFYAFSCRPRAFPGGWRFMPRLMAINQARALGYHLHAAPGEMDPLRHQIAGAATRPPFGDVRDWFAARLVIAPDEG